MKQIYYVLQTLIHGRGANVIKIISLTLGITVSILIFAREAFEFSYDTCYDDYERLCIVKTVWSYNGGEHPSYITLGPVAGALLENFSEDLECATTTQQWWQNSAWFYNDHRFQTNAMTADSCFFETMGVTVFTGDPKELNNPDVLFISRSLAKEMFASQDPVGKTVVYNKQMPMTVKGVYEDFPENSSLYRSQIVMSMATARKYDWGYWGWDGGDSYMACVRLRKSANLDKLNIKIKKYIEEIRQDKGVTISLVPIKDFRIDSGSSSMRMIGILMILATAILFIVTLNYVLISISSMSRRAKSIGVHKCNGAGSGSIFAMFMWETVVVLIISLLLMGFLLLNFRDMIEDILGVSLNGLFGWENIWAPLCVVLFLLIIGGVLPGQLFSRIPVTQVFRRYTDGKKGWKRPLLFVQFSGVAFIFSLLTLILTQSYHIASKNRGFDYERVAYADGAYFKKDSEAAHAIIKSFPCVEDLTSSSNLIVDGLSGSGVTTDDGKWLSMRWMLADKNFAPFMKLNFVKGRNFAAPDEILVNETFLRMMHWEENPIGRQVHDKDMIYGNIVGVMKDFSTENPAYVGVQPLFMTYQKTFCGMLQVRLKEPFDDNLKLLNEEVERALPQYDIIFSPFQKVIDDQNNDITNFRNAAILAAITILFVTLMGLIGYINDEIQRRSKEIAIRKVNGAEASSILVLLSKDIFWISLPALVIGTVCAWYMGNIWMEQFAEVATFPVVCYILVALGVLVLIIGCVILKAWRIANENPVKSIKSE